MITYPSSNCSYCPLKKNINKKILTWNNFGDKKVIIVNDYPTNTNARQVFTQAQMKYVRRILSYAKIGYQEIYMTNLLKCPSTPKDNRELAQQCCDEVLQKELKGRDVIFGFGEGVLNYFTGLDKINVRRGSIYELTTGQLFVGTTTIYSILMANFSDQVDRKMSVPIDIVVEDAKKVKRLLQGIVWKHKENYEIRPDNKSIEKWYDLLYDSRKKEAVAADIETSYYKGQPTIGAYPLTISFGYVDKGIVLNFDDHLAEIMLLLKSPAPKIFQNGVFDLTVLTNSRIKVVNWDRDTMYMHHLLYSELPHNMQFLQSVYTSLPYHKDMVSFGDDKDV